MRLGTEPTGREGTEGLQKRVPHMLTEAVTGDRTEAAAVCVSHLSDVHTRHVDRKQPDGAMYTPQCLGYFCTQ